MFIDKSQRDINSKDVYLINTNDGLYIKNIDIKDNNVALVSNNELYKDITLNIDDVSIIGKVSGVLIKI